MDQRRELVLAAASPGANLSKLCKQFGISRTNGHKWLRRYRKEGLAGLEDKSRRPLRVTGTDGETVLQLIELRRQYPDWGAKKLQVLLVRKGHTPVPSTKTIARILDRAQEPRVRKVRRRRLRLVSRDFEALAAKESNDVWTVDFKGWWRTMDGRRFEPLTVRDAFSRYVLCLEMLGTMKATAVKPVFERLFQAHGLPRVIRVDNGAPFACTSAPAGLSRLSAWWTSVGIRVSFGRPAHPQDNGAHERMHADVAAELEAEPASTQKHQQQAADKWRREFNEVRPHEALEMRTPSQLYKRSPRHYRGIRQATYSPGYAIRRVNAVGAVYYAGRCVFISASVAGHDVAIRRTNKRGGIRVRFYDIDLGTFDLASAPLHHAPRFIPVRPLTVSRRASS
jgi:transposase InsO family protein